MQLARSGRSPTFCIHRCSMKQAFVSRFGPLLKALRSAAGLRSADLPVSFERLSPELETAIFRIVQECLTNVHRHSGGKDASIRLARENGCVVLEVADVGRGISRR